jgi:SsrA-binding protein
MKIISENRRARFDYEILETYEAGIELNGQEVKSIKTGRMNMGASYAIIRGGEAWLLNTEIPAYQPKNAPADYASDRTRRLLLRTSQIKELTGRLHEKGLSLIPVKTYLKKNLIKVELGLARNRKKIDKREVIKKREVNREISRNLKN